MSDVTAAMKFAPGSVDELVSLLDQLAADADEIPDTSSEQQDLIRAALNDAVSRIEKTQ